MTGDVIILGAKGRFGRAATGAFLEAGWTVRTLARRWGRAAPRGAEALEGDAMDGPSLIKACRGADVIVNAVNPPYPDWARVLPLLTRNVIAAARESGATVMIPGNVYNFGPLAPGEAMPEVLSEDLPQRPASRKGALRVAMEREYETAARDGVRTLILRAGDFIEREKTGNWFDSQMTTQLHRGRFTYPGPLDLPHAWAYLPDMGRAMAALAARRDAFPAFYALGFPGYTLTGSEMRAHLEAIAGRKLSLSGMPWTAVRAAALFSPLMREVLEMRYLWREAHTIDGARFRDALPDYQPTPVEKALRDAISLRPALQNRKGRAAQPAH